MTIKISDALLATLAFRIGMSVPRDNPWTSTLIFFVICIAIDVLWAPFAHKPKKRID